MLHVGSSAHVWSIVHVGTGDSPVPAERSSQPVQKPRPCQP
jgi:hypothetical protein